MKSKMEDVLQEWAIPTTTAVVSTQL